MEQISDFVDWVFKNELLVGFIVNGLLLTLVTGLLHHSFNKKLEGIKTENQLIIDEQRSGQAHSLQIDSFFRSISGEKLADTFEEWTDLLLDMTRKTASMTEEDVTKMIKYIFMYGSPKTVELARNYQQYNYALDTSKRTQVQNWEILILAAETICSLKNDFTGHKISSKILLDLKISDINDPEKKAQFEEAWKNVMGEGSQ
ncbi:hypothetical protein HCA69_02375 [Listeria grandensis]|uniref:Uncharacterized protein n=1 Tax=Listeria grandensis TaxID=1494963 RepID=A0A7X0Y1F7_9LIST|nr:hypothetical protein [Listeria grandensis]MBC1935196.1 hypothetical protein [Listeria grandensis]